MKTEINIITTEETKARIDDYLNTYTKRHHKLKEKRKNEPKPRKKVPTIKERMIDEWNPMTGKFTPKY